MTDATSVRLARGVQHLLPVALLLVAFLELSALLPVTFTTLDVGGVAALLGPASFVPVSLAVVWAAFLPATRSGQLVKVVTAVGTTGFVGARLALTISWWVEAAGDGTLGWSATILGLAGLLLGVSLLVWSVIDVAATRFTLVAPRLEQRPPMAVSPVVASPILASSPSTPERVPSPTQPSGITPATTPPPGWKSESTPWPRRDESDPEGTLIRPPRQQRRRR